MYKRQKRKVKSPARYKDFVRVIKVGRPSSCLSQNPGDLNLKSSTPKGGTVWQQRPNGTEINGVYKRYDSQFCLDVDDRTVTVSSADGCRDVMCPVRMAEPSPLKCEFCFRYYKTERGARRHYILKHRDRYLRGRSPTYITCDGEYKRLCLREWQGQQHRRPFEQSSDCLLYTSPSPRD